MKSKVVLILVSFFFLSLAAFAQTEEEQVKAVITSAYINGIQNGGPIEDIRKGFHPTFVMQRFMDNEVKPLSIEEWIVNIEKNRAQNTSAAPVKTEGKFISISVVGTAANVVLELYRADKKIFTDNLLLYKVKDGWQIVAKSYYRHP